MDKLAAYKLFIEKCTKSPNSVNNYCDFMKINRWIKYVAPQYNGILSIETSNEVTEVLGKLLALESLPGEPEGKVFRNAGQAQYYNAVKTYIMFLNSLEISKDYQAPNSEDSKVGYSRSLPLDLPLQQIFYGAPGTGKSHTIKTVTGKYKVIRTTFHPDSDYSTFVGAYKPAMEKGANGERKIIYKFIPQAFMQAYVEAWQDLSKPVFLMIEEINRGNCAQIFGDIFQLLDREEKGYSSYSINPNEDIMLHLAEVFEENGIDAAATDEIKSGEKLCLPPNLYIWATMNTSDQSLFPIDSAFKRRWDWKYVPIDTHKENWKIQTTKGDFSWSSFLKQINEEIGETTSSEDKKLGFYFCKAKDGVITTERFVAKVLFYVYNDVFKDYGFDKEFFKKDQKTISFQQFYNMDGSVNDEMVAVLLSNLKVEKFGEIVDNDEPEEDEDGNSINSSPTGRDYTKYSIDGKGRYAKNNLAAECVTRYIELHPDKTADEVVNDWLSLGYIVSHFIETKEQFDARTDKNKRAREIACGDTVIYVECNGYGANGKAQTLMEAINEKDWGFTVSEAK